jgi:uncharacterized protein
MSFKPPTPQAVMIEGPSGPIEAIVEDPGLPADAMAVICHPHPQQGGTMNNKVVHTLARACNECGVPSVRFNYRGVGNSAGHYDEGRGETDDALAVVNWARSRWPNAVLWLAGFSFGGGVALRAAVRTGTSKLITVAPAAMRTAAPATLPTCPWLLIQGDADEVIDTAMVIDWVNTLTVKPQVQVMTSAGHFFHGRLIELRELVTQWLRH